MLFINNSGPKYILIIVLLIISALSTCRSFTLQNPKGEPEFNAGGTWRLVPITSEPDAILGDYYTTGTLEIIKNKNSTYKLSVSILWNAQAMDRIFQTSDTWEMGIVTTSKKEIAVENAEYLRKSRNYQGQYRSLHNLEDKFSDWTFLGAGPDSGQGGKAITGNRDLYFEYISPDTLSFRCSRYFVPGQEMVFKKIKKEEVEKKEKKWVISFLGSVFLIIQDEKQITVAGNRVDKKLPVNKTIYIVTDRKVTAIGKIISVFPTHAKAQIIKGIDKIRPRDIVVAY